MRVVEHDGEQIKCHGPGVAVRRRHQQRDREQRCGPRAAAYQQVEPRTVNPWARRCWRVRGRRGLLSGNRFCGDGQARNLEFTQSARLSSTYTARGMTRRISASCVSAQFTLIAEASYGGVMSLC